METISFERMQPLGEVAAMLPAATYNLTRSLLGGRSHAFVPIRAMQYLLIRHD